LELDNRGLNNFGAITDNDLRAASKKNDCPRGAGNIGRITMPRLLHCFYSSSVLYSTLQCNRIYCKRIRVEGRIGAGQLA